MTLWPPMLVIALAVKLQDGGPALFGHVRVGKDLRHFKMWKFRSMVKDAATIGSFRTAQNDPRITKLGAFLRKSSLDELPQLLNVLKGEMSLIGPRPDTPAQEADYTSEQWLARHKVRPGVAGLAQVMGRSSLSAEQRTAYDLQYAQEASFWLDMKICVKAVGVILHRKGAF